MNFPRVFVSDLLVMSHYSVAQRFACLTYIIMLATIVWDGIDQVFRGAGEIGFHFEGLTSFN